MILFSHPSSLPAQYAAVVAVASRRKVPIRSPFGLTLDDMIACIAKGDANVERNLHGLAEIQRETEARLEVSRPDAFVSLGIMKSRSAEILGRVFASPSRPLVVEIGVHIHRDDEKNLLAEILATLRKMGTPFDCVSFQALHPDATRP